MESGATAEMGEAENAKSMLHCWTNRESKQSQTPMGGVQRALAKGQPDIAGALVAINNVII
jgi:hypothetical protein